jgi:hypothetical protein
MQDFLKEYKITRVLNAVAAGTTQQTGTQLDMAGYDGVCHILLLNTVVSTCVLTLQLQDSAVSGSGMANIANSLVTITDAGGVTSNLMIVLDVVLPALRYVQCVLTRTVANATIDAMVAIQYRSKARGNVGLPQALVQPAGVVASVFIVANG